MYEENFIDNQTFSWKTKNNVTLNSNVVKAILDDKTTCYLFIQRSDGDSNDFYYMGPVKPIVERTTQTTMMDDMGRCLPVVNIIFQLQSKVPDDVFSYITS